MQSLLRGAGSGRTALQRERPHPRRIGPLLTGAGRAARASSSSSSSSSSSGGSVEIASLPSRSSPEMCVIVDEHNRVVGAATRKATVSKRLLGRGSYVLVFDGDGPSKRLFVSQRSARKDVYPGCLDVTISGVVNQGEAYEETAARELQEEIGIPLEHSTAHLQRLCVFPYQDAFCHVWGCLFSMRWDGAVCFQDQEVDWGRFTPLAELQQLLQEQPERFTPVGQHIMQLYLEQQQQQQQRADFSKSVMEL